MPTGDYISDKKAFARIKFIDAFPPEPSEQTGIEISAARKEVLHFLQQRRLQIANRYQVQRLVLLMLLQIHIPITES